MRKNFRLHLFASLAVLAVSGVPVTASAAAIQDEEEPEAEAPAADDKQAVIDSWPDQRRAAYELWPDDTKDYYWTLSDDRQKLFWGLADPDKITLSQMNEEDRSKVWARLEQKGSAVL